MVEIDVIFSTQQRWTQQWHVQPVAPCQETPWRFLQTNHQMNFDLWHEEDIARRDDVGADRVLQAKRAIDRFNQSRNDAVEQFDAWLLQQLPVASASVPMHTETPGMCIDRLSIMALKIFHMQIEAERNDAGLDHCEKCRAKLAILEVQANDLVRTLGGVLAQMNAGKLQFKLYRQMKMYNDPALNPQLYAAP